MPPGREANRSPNSSGTTEATLYQLNRVSPYTTSVPHNMYNRVLETLWDASSLDVWAQLLLRDMLPEVAAAVQAYVVCELQDKLNVLWAFIKAHLKVRPTLRLSQSKTSDGLAAVLPTACTSLRAALRTSRVRPVSGTLFCSGLLLILFMLQAMKEQMLPRTTSPAEMQPDQARLWPAGEDPGVPDDGEAGEVCTGGVPAAAAGDGAARAAWQDEADEAHGCLLRLQRGVPHAFVRHSFCRRHIRFTELSCAEFLSLVKLFC